jgi:hypothetical protein
VVKGNIGAQNITDDEQYKRLSSDNSPLVRKNVVLHPFTQTHHLDKFVNDESPDVRKMASYSDKLTTEHIDKLAGDKSDSVVMALSNRKDIPAHIQDKLLGDMSYPIRTNHILKHQKGISKSIIDGIVSDEYSRFNKGIDLDNIADQKNLTREHMHTLIDQGETDSISKVLRHPNCDVSVARRIRDNTGRLDTEELATKFIQDRP